MRRLSAVVAAVCLLGVLGLAGCAPPEASGPTSTYPSAAPLPLPPVADGIAFIRDGRAFVIQAGVAREVAANGAEKRDVAYSADGKVLLVTEARQARRVVRIVAAAERVPGPVVLESDDGSNLGPVHAVSSRGPLYHAVFGDPVNRLMVSGVKRGSKASPIPLRGTFSGEFDVDAWGRAIVYTGAGQNPASVVIRTGAAERPLAVGLATAFTPSFASDGELICLTGSKRTGEPISIYVASTASGRARVVDGTEDLMPTSPVFSTDGRSIAFRSAVDGSIWIVPSAGGTPRRLGVTADEGSIGW